MNEKIEKMIEDLRQYDVKVGMYLRPSACRHIISEALAEKDAEIEKLKLELMKAEDYINQNYLGAK